MICRWQQRKRKPRKNTVRVVEILPKIISFLYNWQNTCEILFFSFLLSVFPNCVDLDMGGLRAELYATRTVWKLDEAYSANTTMNTTSWRIVVLLLSSMYSHEAVFLDFNLTIGHSSQPTQKRRTHTKLANFWAECLASSILAKKWHHGNGPTQIYEKSSTATHLLEGEKKGHFRIPFLLRGVVAFELAIKGYFTHQMTQGERP